MVTLVTLMAWQREDCMLQSWWEHGRKCDRYLCDTFSCPFRKTCMRCTVLRWLMGCNAIFWMPFTSCVTPATAGHLRCWKFWKIVNFSPPPLYPSLSLPPPSATSSPTFLTFHVLGHIPISLFCMQNREWLCGLHLLQVVCRFVSFSQK